ncbi:MAG: PD-(D/E)XK nuclease family protein, partial [Eggerthellaceae bacterium]|nr:PD-(D/E)XK nuclease family protein [Eggerthellaceae bacterium]
FERRELDACKRQLVDYLDFEAAFLPTFHPAYFEHEIGVQDGVVYAGHPFMGIVDRIDVDDAGNAVIVDYKGSVGPAHEIAGKGVHDPGKVQTRMYARAVERALGLKVVGAFYVSYGKSHGCAGAFDGRAIEAAHVPNARVGKCSCALEQPDCVDQVDDFSQLTFSGMLDATEALVSDAIDSMVAGRVQPAPATPDACRYCPVANCSARGA